jgi:hypothetical protein
MALPERAQEKSEMAPLIFYAPGKFFRQAFVLHERLCLLNKVLFLFFRHVLPPELFFQIISDSEKTEGTA